MENQAPSAAYQEAARRASSVPCRTTRGSLQPLGEQPQLIHTSRTNLVHDGNDVAILGAGIASNVNGFIEPTGQPVLNLAGEVVLLHLGAAQINPAIAGDGND